MDVVKRMKLLKFSLVAFGLFFIFGLVPMMHFFSDSWGWEPSQYEYEQMIQGVYATLGVFLILAAKNPLEHRSLIWFTVWSSLVHGAIMLFQALYDKSEHANLYGDVPALFMVAIILAVLMPKK
jgi:hypothetical protein